MNKLYDRTLMLFVNDDGGILRYCLGTITPLMYLLTAFFLIYTQTPANAGVCVLLRIDFYRLRDAYAFAKFIPVSMIYAALDRSECGYEVKN